MDFGAREGKLLRTERLNTFDNGRITADADRRADDVAFLNEQGLHADIVRIGPNESLCNVTTNTCDFTPVADWLSDVSDASDSVVVHLTPRNIIQAKRSPAEAKPLLKMLIKGLKERFPRIEYIEAFNEPDWGFHGAQVRAGQTPVLQPEELYPYYVPFYEAVNEVNKELRPKVPLKVGGPTLMSFDHAGWIEAFLDGYAADPNPKKRLDFISYHGYGSFAADFRSFHAYKFDPSDVSTQRARLDRWLKERHITKHIPSFITETGIYPGPSFDDPDPSKTDYVRQAAGLASLHYWWSNQRQTLPFNWTVRHAGEERKDQLITRVPEGPVPTGIFSPYGNMMVMQSKMKTTKVQAASDTLKAGQGVYAVASKDKTGASVMVWNYQHVNEGRFRTTIDMSRLPANLRRGPVRQTLFRIDQATSNYWTNPQRANLQQVDERIVKPGKSYSETVDLEPNGIYLVILEPA